jgi:lipid II:glycine glycyltransferase (peptidoglycan interpeptide bridge formation enzyme)
MTEKELKTNIKKTRDFIDLWVTFHDLYKNATKKEAITQEEENLFLETKSLVAKKYTDLKDSLQSRLAADDKTPDVISHVLSLKGVAAVSDEVLQRIEQSWNHSHDVLNRISTHLEEEEEESSKKRRLSQKTKGIFSHRAVQVVILIATVFVLFYGVSLIIGLLVK